ncbi:hypothetical protein FQA47_008052 [Oryzias melastigma]|uniref:Uncharacterized protein n=1 Tax=Oryzias melastigma TaxID=30732 RepID=A0A834CSL6_ORYME|nr:hypothetical protein FQA47_008052 [Oryzias melastigma]
MVTSRFSLGGFEPETLSSSRMKPQALSDVHVNRPFNLVPAPLVLVALCRTFPVRKQLCIRGRERSVRAGWMSHPRTAEPERPGRASLSGSASSGGGGAALLREPRAFTRICGITAF